MTGGRGASPACGGGCARATTSAAIASGSATARCPQVLVGFRHRVYIDAFETDVRPVLARLREELGVAPDPVETFRAGGYADQRATERGNSSVESAHERS